MDFHEWLSLLKTKNQNLVNEKDSLLMELWSLDVVIADTTSSATDKQYATEHLKTIMMPMINTLVQKIQEIDGTKPPSSANPIDWYYEAKKILQSKEDAQTRITKLVSLYPDLTSEFPPPRKNIEEHVDKYEKKIHETHRYREEQRKCNEDLSSIHAQAEAFCLETTTYTPPYNPIGIQKYISVLVQKVEQQKILQETWFNIRKRAQKINYPILDQKPPYIESELQKLENAVQQAEEIATHIFSIEQKAQKLHYSIERSLKQRSNRLFVEKILSVREKWWTEYDKMETQFAEIGWNRIFTPDIRNEESIPIISAELTEQKRLYQEWYNNTDSTRAKIQLTFPLTSKKLRDYSTKLAFDQNWRKKISTIVEGTKVQHPLLPHLITESNLVEMMPILQELEKKAELERVQIEREKNIQKRKAQIMRGIETWKTDIPQKLSKYHPFLAYLYWGFQLYLFTICILCFESWMSLPSAFSLENTLWYISEKNIMRILFCGLFVQDLVQEFIAYEVFWEYCAYSIPVILGSLGAFGIGGIKEEGAGCGLFFVGVLICVPVITIIRGALILLSWLVMAGFGILSLPLNVIDIYGADKDFVEELQIPQLELSPFWKPIQLEYSNEFHRKYVLYQNYNSRLNVWPEYHMDGYSEVFVWLDAKESASSKTKSPKGVLVMTSEVTQKLYQDTMDTNPSYFNDCGALCPVENVYWVNALKMANTLSKKQGLPLCYQIEKKEAKNEYEISWPDNDCLGWRLPTTKEWRFLSHIEKDSHYNYSWVQSNSKSKSHTVSLKTPNKYKLYDLHGNVAEWVWDPQNPHSPFTINLHDEYMIQGHSWRDSSNTDIPNLHSTRSNIVGFRLLRQYK